MNDCYQTGHFLYYKHISYKHKNATCQTDPKCREVGYCRFEPTSQHIKYFHNLLQSKEHFYQFFSIYVKSEKETCKKGRPWQRITIFSRSKGQRHKEKYTKKKIKFTICINSPEEILCQTHSIKTIINLIVRSPELISISCNPEIKKP